MGSALTFIKYGTEKLNDKSYSLYSLFKEVQNDIVNVIKHISVRAFITLGSLAIAFAAYIIFCATYPGEFINAYVFVIDHWIEFEILFLVIFVYITYKILKVNFIHHGGNKWINWLYVIIMALFWLLLIVMAVNYSKIADIISSNL
jgi:hypothetical protein